VEPKCFAPLFKKVDFLKVDIYMCFNYKVSLFTFAIGTIFSIFLINYGSNKYALENKVSGIFFLFISAIQLMDFFFWIDLKNKYGINQLATILGPILNVCQPTILYVIKYLFYKPNLQTNTNLFVAIANILYFFYFIAMYIEYLSKEKMVTTAEHNHLKWPWIKYANPIYYLILFAINIFYLFNFNYGVTLFTITYFFLYLSKKYFYYNTGELWCFFGSFIPLIMYFASFYI